MTCRPLLLDTRIRIDGVPVRLTVTRWGTLTMGTVYHFEYRSLAEPHRAIPISNTGYKSNYLIAQDALSAQKLEAYAEQYCSMLLDGTTVDQPEQPSLFG